MSRRKQRARRLSASEELFRVQKKGTVFFHLVLMIFLCNRHMERTPPPCNSNFGVRKRGSICPQPRASYITLLARQTGLTLWGFASSSGGAIGRLESRRSWIIPWDSGGFLVPGMYAPERFVFGCRLTFHLYFVQGLSARPPGGVSWCLAQPSIHVQAKHPASICQKSLYALGGADLSPD